VTERAEVLTALVIRDELLGKQTDDVCKLGFTFRPKLSIAWNWDEASRTWYNTILQANGAPHQDSFGKLDS
jgi:hypothetical protein